MIEYNNDDTIKIKNFREIIYEHNLKNQLAPRVQYFISYQKKKNK